MRCPCCENPLNEIDIDIIQMSEDATDVKVQMSCDACGSMFEAIIPQSSFKEIEE